MPGMMDLLFLKSGAAGAENEGERAYLLMLEKASMLIVLFFILMIVVDSRDNLSFFSTE